MLTQAEGVARGWRFLAGLSCVLALTSAPRIACAGSCEALSPRSANVLGFGTDYLPRVDFHGGEPGDACAFPLPASLPGALSIPLHAYNLQGEATGVRLRLISSVEIQGFTPVPGVSATVAAGPRPDGAFWILDLELAGTLCGPLVLGSLDVIVPAGATAAFVDVAGLGGSGAPLVINASRGSLPAVSPRHGAFVGAYDAYHCQPPLCREPNAPAGDFAPLQSGGFVIELGWKAGGGDFTMIRYRADGTPPASIFDGELLMLLPTVPGQRYAIVHENPQASQYWYTAFAVTVTGDEVTLGSRLECDSFTHASVDPSIPVTGSTWGALKNAYR